MKRVISILFIVLILLISFVPIHANEDEGKTLDEVIQENKQSQTVSNPSNARESANNLIKDLQNATVDLTKSDARIDKATEGLRTIVSFAVRLISFIVTYGLTLKVVLDLAYITIPFLRGILANGHVGNAQAGTGVSTQNNSFGSFGNWGPTGFGYNQNFGYNSGLGGFNRPFGSSQPTQQSILHRLQFVSTVALNAVAAENSVGPDGKPVKPLKLYAKDMILTLIVTPLLLVLSLTGALTQLGFIVGNVVAKLIAGLGGSML